MIGPLRIEGLAIVSADGMLADGSRRVPPGLIVPADQEFFQATLDRAAFVVHGRHSHEGGPRAAARYRLLVTARTAALGPDRTHPKSLLWNPKGASLGEAWARLGAPAGVCAVIGGPRVYQLFAEIGYDAFHLSRAANVRVPGGLPIFPEVGPERRPDDVLAQHGLTPGPQHVLDAAAAVTLVTWVRRSPD
jgi:hypothetical protein